jgi:hypothetical protein
VPAELQALVARAVATDRAERYPDVQSLLSDLEGIRRNLERASLWAPPPLPPEPSPAKPRATATPLVAATLAATVGATAATLTESPTDESTHDLDEVHVYSLSAVIAIGLTIAAMFALLVTAWLFATGSLE